MPNPPRNLPHFHIEGGGDAEAFTSPRVVISGLPPSRVRAAHAQKLQQALSGAVAAARQQISTRDQAVARGEPGFYLEFEVPAAHRVALDGLENKRKGIELVAVHPQPIGSEVVAATVFVPERAADFFSDKVVAYRDEETRTGRPKNQNLVARIEDVRLGDPRSLFTDEPSTFPAPTQSVWWEVWLRDGRVEPFRAVAHELGLVTKPSSIRFPERDVLLVLGSTDSIRSLIANSDAVAELRLAKDTPSDFLEMKSSELGEWIDNLSERVSHAGGAAPVVCLLDSGATQQHPLISGSLDAADLHTYDQNWGVNDSIKWGGHGTAMCGVTLYGDLHPVLLGSAAVSLTHRLEMVKILPPTGSNDPQLYGAITEAAVKKVEDANPHRPRLFCMAVTSSVGLGRGRPSSWSAAIDQLSYGGGDRRRLMVLCAGNIREEILAIDYPDANDLAEIESPAQSWNSITAGAFTEKVNITHSDYAGWSAIAPAGELAPVSRTSTIWDRQWPIKPEVVFEGGNLACDATSVGAPIDDLQLLSTHFRPQMRLLESFGDTSAATGLCANLVAGVLAARPNLWPETLRALVVHSAEWTEPMRTRFDAATSIAQKAALLRRYGWGVPSLERALLSASNDATMIVEDALIPFKKDGSSIKTRQMNLHRLPWPREELLALGDASVELRVTLSYFVEPDPGERGWTRRHRYASHSLRFAVKRSLETQDQFRQRINKAAKAEEEDQAQSPSGADNWVLGPNVRDRGSIHSDVWRGTASELAERDAIGIFPVSGWWKEKPSLQRWERSARYALVVSVRAPDLEIDLYNAIASKIGVEVPAT